jgi:hypothetical protein
VGPVLERPQRRELRLEPWRHELVEPLRLRQVFQAMLAEVARLDADEVVRRLREHDLTAVRGRADARGAVNVHPDVVVADDGRRSGVDPHPHAQRQSLEGALTGRRRGDGVVGAREREEERVALSVDLVAVSECLAQPAAVLLERACVLVCPELVE